MALPLGLGAKSTRAGIYSEYGALRVAKPPSHSFGGFVFVELDILWYSITIRGSIHE